jgi:hypothetical protein
MRRVERLPAGELWAMKAAAQARDLPQRMPHGPI